jgi:hypothetical protein
LVRIKRRFEVAVQVREFVIRRAIVRSRTICGASSIEKASAVVGAIRRSGCTSMNNAVATVGATPHAKFAIREKNLHPRTQTALAGNCRGAMLRPS